MARQSIDIGVQGNDGTGDSIREAFRKVNENFRDLYAVFGQGDKIAFTDLDDTPSSYASGQLIAVNSAGDRLVAKNLSAGVGISITNNDTDVTITSTSSSLSTDPKPTLGGAMNGAGLPIANIAYPSTSVVNQFNALYGPSGTTITLDDLAITKGYADRNYIQQLGGSASGQLRVRSEPANATQYTETIGLISNNNLFITAHGFTSASDGAAYKYNSTGTPAGYAGIGTNNTPGSLVNGTTYYVRYVNDNELSIHTTANDAKANTQKIILQNGSGSGTQTITDAFYKLVDDDGYTLDGFWLSNEALPRESVVRRQGDHLAGAIYLHDHPGTLSGAGTPNGPDDLQAATKYYVDNSSFASSVNLFVTTTGDDAQANTPTGKEGRAYAYAYETVGAACAKAEELIELGYVETGPYRQRITYTLTGTQYESSTSAVAFTNSTGYTGVQSTLNANREYIRAEVIGYINATYPTLNYKQDLCSRDIGIIIDAIIIDVLVNGNYQSVMAGKAYFRNASAAIASSTQQTETVAGVIYAKYLAGQVLQGLNPTTSYQSVYARQAVIGTVTAPARSSVADKFDIITNIISNGISAAPAKGFGTGFVTVSFGNGGATYVDQGNPTNIDIIPGKILYGVTSGAVGKILSYASGSSTDTITLNLLKPVNFIANEKLEFAEPNKELQITIRMESGIYYEDFPIRVPANVSIVGDDFRRTIIRPRDRASQSPWIQTWFYRDTTFDGLTLTTTNYGYHYLENPALPMDLGPTYTNAGNYSNAAKLLEINKAFIQAEVNAYITAVYPAVSYDTAKTLRDTGLIVDALITDLNAGGKANVVDIAARYYTDPIPVGERTARYAGITYIGTIAQSIIQNILLTGGTTPPKRGSVDQIINTGYTAEVNSGTAITNLVSTVVYSNNVNFNPPKNNRHLDVFLLNDATRLNRITGQGHGGFMCVLDPAGQIRSKSPYIQEGASFSKSISKQAFAGGMFIDGFSGRLQCTITSVTNAGKTLTVSGLTKREPIAPTAFFVAGARYQVDNVRSWDPNTGIAVLDINPTTPWSGGNVAIILETPGNRSMLANDFTQVNDLGYGVVAHNNGLTEQVSTFTYYCYTAYLASNGGQIRSVAGSNANGVYGLKAVGSDPTEVPDPIVLSGDLVQSGQVVKYGSYLTSGIAGGLSFYYKRYRTIPTSTSEIEIYRNNLIESYELRTIEGTGVYDNKYTYRVTAATQANPCVITTTPSATISAATKASPCVITTSANHNYLDGDFIRISSVVGMTQLNNKNFYVDVLSPNTFALYTDSTLTNPVDSTNYTTYSSAGSITANHSFHAGDRVKFASVGGMTQLNGNLYYVNPLSATTFALYTDAALTTTVNSTAFGVYTSGGTVTDDIPYSISAISKANPCQVTTSVAHNFNNGDIVTIAGVGGMTQVSGNYYAKVNGSATIQLYTDSTLVTPVDSTGYTTYTSGGTVNGGQEILKLGLNTSGNNNTIATGLSADLWDDLNVAVRVLQNFRFSDVFDVKPTRPSTALEFNDTLGFQPPYNLYRVIAYGISEATGAAEPANTAILSSDSSFVYFKPITLPSAVNTTDPINGAKKLGAQVGDIRIAVDPSSMSADLISACNANKFIFHWAGKIHRVVSFTAVAGPTPAYITIADVYDNNTVPTATGIAAAFSTSNSFPYTMRLGLPSGSAAQVTVKISTCRATGHDFLDIGSGGYNTSNYPSAIYGSPSITPNKANQVIESSKGRVFYVSTDQDGIFRVGKYFTVDQGTGTVTFAASLALSNLDGLGFKRGVVVAEFSTDNTMTNNAADTVPTQSAVRGYIDKRLGLDHAGGIVNAGSLIGPGYMALNGTLGMKSNMNLAGYKIQNLGAPTISSDAVNKDYVDTRLALQNQLSELTDVNIGPLLDGDFLVFSQGTWYNASMTGSIKIDFDSTANNVIASIAPLSITNASISTSAAIDQSKLNLSNATAGATAGASTKGIASFDSANFGTASGWISIKDGGVARIEMADIGNGSILGNFSGGATFPQEVSANTVTTKGLESILGSLSPNIGLIQRTASEAFSIVGTTTTGTGNSIVKTDSSGVIDVQGLKINSVSILDYASTTINFKTPGGFTIVSATGTNAANTTVTLNGQFALGVGSSLVASSAVSATNATNATKLDVGGTYRTADTTAGANTIAARDASGNLTANVFNGVATSARYADLAEWYTADKEYEPGTVLVFGGDAETTTTNVFGDARLAGVVTTDPGFVMNSELTGTRACIALQGRVPCKVVGRVKKGDMLTTAGIVGHAAKAIDPRVGTIIGKALEDKDYTEAGVIEVAIGRV